MNKTQQFWDKQAAKYDYSERGFDPVFKKVLTQTKKHLTADDIVLDYGCATGTKTFELAEAVKQIHGLDISSEMIDSATKRLATMKIDNAHFSHGTIFDNSLTDASFDKIVAYGIIHLLEDGEKVIRRIHNLLKPNGLFISSTACLKEKMALRNRTEFSLYLLAKKIGLFPLHLNMFTTTAVEMLISNNGFQIIEAERIFHGITISYIVAKRV